MKHGAFNMIPEAKDKVDNEDSLHQDPSYSHIKITNEGNAQHSLGFQGYCSLLIHSTRPNSKPRLFYRNS